MRHRSMVIRALHTTLAIGMVSGIVSVHAQPARRGTKTAKPVGQVIDAVRAKRAMGEERLGTPISANQQMTANFTQSDPLLNDGSHYHRYMYSGRAGERITIVMRSTDFQSYVFISRPVGNELESIARDDGTLGTNAHIEIQLPVDGPYVIVANTYKPNLVGTYTLSVTSRTPARAVNWASVYPGGGDPGERYALLVGIDEYPDTNDLTGPVRDANIMRDVLIRKYGFDPRNIVLITDGEATRERIANAFLRHLGQAGPNGVAVFFYSGHGSQTRENQAIQMPLDLEADNKDEALVLWGTDGRVSFLLDDEMGFMIDRLGAGRTLIVLDACFSGTATRGRGQMQGQRKLVRLSSKQVQMPSQLLVDRRGRATSAAHKAGVPTARTAVARARGAGTAALNTADILGDPRNHVLLTASSDNEYSYTVPDWPARGGVASVMTYYLADALEADDGTMTISAIMDRVRDQSRSRTLRFPDGPQTPQVEGTRRNETFASFLARR